MKTQYKYITSTPNIMGGQPVIKGTRILIERILYLLKQGYPIEAIHSDYSWVDFEVLNGAVEEAIEGAIENITLHVKSVS